MPKFTQLSLSDVYDCCDNMSFNEKPELISIIESVIDFNEFIPLDFHLSFYRHFGRKRSYPLVGFISALVLQKLLSIPTIPLLINILSLSKELRDLCGFVSIPDETRFSIFKRDFTDQLQDMFNKLVDYTEPICQRINDQLADILVYDTTGVECFVAENNPKFVNSSIKRLKSIFKANKELPDDDPNKIKNKNDVYAIAYANMPKYAHVDPSILQMYINGHFCYARKFGILTNGLGIPRAIVSLDNDFKLKYPELVLSESSESPDKDKSIADSSSLRPVLKEYFSLHPGFSYDTFLGDSGFDSVDNYTFLIDDCRFKKAVIPLNTRNESSLPSVGFNEYGYPVCPNDADLVMKRCGITKEEGRSTRIKWVCPNVHMVNGKYICDCDNPCSDAVKGRTTYTYNNDYRKLPGILRDSEEYNELYKIRPIIERCINHFKDSMCIANGKTRNLNTIKSDMLLAGIAQLITVVAAERLHKPEHCRSFKALIA